MSRVAHGPSINERRIEELRAQARYAQDRLRLYRARAYGQRPVDSSRMRDLERAAANTAERLRHGLTQGPVREGMPEDGS